MFQGRHLKLQVPEYFRKHKLLFPKRRKLLFLLTSPYLFTTHTQNHMTTFFALVWIELDFLSALILVRSYIIFLCSYSYSKEVEELKVWSFPI